MPPVGSGALFSLLVAQWPAYAVYVVSFLTIGIVWVNHHATFALVRRVDRPLVFLDLLSRRPVPDYFTESEFQ